MGDEFMKKKFLFLFVSLIVLLAACSKDSEKAPGDKEVAKPDQPPETEQKEPDNKMEEENKEDDDQEEPAKKDEPAVATGDNLLAKDLVFEYNDGDTVLTLDLAEFTTEYTTATGEETRKKNSAESEILFHVKGKVNNDTLNSFSYGHQLGQVTFKLIYDNKHEFELLGTAESPDGSKFVGASVDSLQEQIIHLSTNVPVPVSEGDKSLILVITDSDGDHEEVLR